MLIGHYAPALILQRARPTVKLWQLFVATQLVDILWGLFVLGGIEHARIVPGFTESNDLELWHMPYSHSLVATVAWAATAFVAWRTVQRTPTRTGDAAVIAIAIASHYAADFIVHVQDLPVLAGDGTKLGLGLWRHRSWALLLETSSFAAAALWWWWPQRGSPRARRAGFALLGLTVLAAGSYYIPTPPTPVAMALTGLATYASIAVVAHWIERAVSAREAADHLG